MAEIQTSFIPKKPITPSVSRRQPVGLLMVIAIIILVLSILFVGGIFFYKQVLAKQVVSAGENFARAKEAFDPGLIVELQRLDTQINAAETILDEHILLSRLFDILESSVIRTVRFNDFSFSKNEAGTTYLLKLKGAARGYSDIAQQSEVFKSQNKLHNVVFTDFSLDARGAVLFTMSAVVDKSLITANTQ